MKRLECLSLLGPLIKDDDREIGRPFVREGRHGSQIQKHAAVGFDSYDAAMRQYQR